MTDAHVVLGHIPPGSISGGVVLDPVLARDAMAPLASALSSSIDQVAAAMISIANAGMARALRRVSVERGIDPAGLTLIAFGGGGPLHGCDLAHMLSMRRVLIPPAAGVLSAFGLAIAAERRESMLSVMRRASELTASDCSRIVNELAERAGMDGRRTRRREFWLRARYVGQGHEIDVPLLEGEAGAAVAERFARIHRERIGFNLPLDVELISARHAASGEERSASWAAHSARTGGGIAAAGRAVVGVVEGPASLSLDDATLLVRPGWTARRLVTGGWLLARDA